MAVHPTAVVSPRATVTDGCSIGPYAIVEEDAVIGPESEIASHAVIKKGVITAGRCFVGEYAVLGGLPQDTRFGGEDSFVEIGEGVVIREFATVHRATGAGARTVIGPDSLIMAYAHVSHNCVLGENVTVVNAVHLAGHVRVDRGAFVGGSTGVHQFVRIGTLAMVGAHSYLTQDLPPYLLGSGNPFRVRGINRVGLERANMSGDTQKRLRKLYRLVYRDPRPRNEAFRDLSSEENAIPEVAEFLKFINESGRGIRLKTGRKEG
jgi:UDP-N-acetylglucosamine acyltransferase